MNNIFHRAAAGQVVAGLIKPLKNSEAVSLADALRNFVADVARLQVRENQDISFPCDRASLGLTCSDFGNERCIELHLTVKQKVGR